MPAAPYQLSTALGGGTVSTEPVGGIEGSGAPLVGQPGLANPATAVSNNPGAINLSAYATQFPASVISAAQSIFNSEPSQAATFQSQYGGNLTNWLQSFTQWWTQNGGSVSGNLGNFQPEVALLGALGYNPPSGTTGATQMTAAQEASYQATSGTTSMPAEQGLYNESIGNLNNQVLNDQNLAKLGQNLENQTQTNYGNLATVLGGAVSPVGGLSAVTTQQNAAIAASAQTQLQALQTSISNMQGALTGDLATKAAALQQTLQQVLSNTATFGSAESQALTQQINTQLSDLTQSISSQKGALNDQIQALSGAADAASQQQLAALQTQLTQLNTAEAPVAAARTAAAQAQVSAVNIGLAQTKNAIQGTEAQQGFVGGSTMEDNALAQASIAAAQTGAGDVGTAALQNTQDYQAIADLGAQQQDTLANTLAQQQQNITGQGATGTYNLETALAQGTQGLQDTGATGQAAIAGNVATQNLSAENTAAETGYTNTATGADTAYNLANALNTGTSSIAANAAQLQQQNIANNYGQSLQASLALGALPGQEAGQIAAEDNLQNTGILDAQNVLNWWAAPAQTPTPATSTTVAGTGANSLATAGSGLLNASVAIGNSNNWWQTPTTPAQTPAQINTAEQPFNPPPITAPDTTLVGSTP